MNQPTRFDIFRMTKNESTFFVSAVIFRISSFAKARLCMCVCVFFFASLSRDEKSTEKLMRIEFHVIKIIIFVNLLQPTPADETTLFFVSEFLLGAFVLPFHPTEIFISLNDERPSKQSQITKQTTNRRFVIIQPRTPCSFWIKFFFVLIRFLFPISFMFFSLFVCSLSLAHFLVRQTMCSVCFFCFSIHFYPVSTSFFQSELSLVFFAFLFLFFADYFCACNFFAKVADT